MDELTTRELFAAMYDARERALIFAMRSRWNAFPAAQKYNAEMHKIHSDKAVKYLAEIVRRQGIE